MQSGNGVTVGKRYVEVAKGLTRQSVAPTLARVRPMAGGRGRRILTGDQNSSKIIGKADVEKLFLGGGLPALKAAATGGLSAVKTGVKAGSGTATALASPAAKPLRMAQAVGTKVGQGLGAAQANPMAAGLGAGAVGGAGLNSLARRKPTQPAPPPSIAKRRYDPEDERRHTQGVVAGVSGTAGLASLAYAGRQARRDTTAMRSGAASVAPYRKPPQAPDTTLRDKNGRPHGSTASQVQYKQNVEQTHAHAMNAWHGEQKGRASAAARLKSTRGVLVRGRTAAAGAGGLALLGTASALGRRKKESRWD